MAVRLPPDLISGVIGRIYDCALDPGQWPAALTALRQALRFHNAALALQALPADTPLISATSGIERPWLERIPAYSEDYIARWGGRARIASLPLDEPAVLSRVNPRANWESTRYYVEWARPQGIIDILAIGVARDAGSVGSVIFGRHEAHGPISDDDVDAARLFVPHLQRAVTISRALDVKALEARTFEAALDRLATAVFLVSASFAIVHANRAALALLAADDILYAARRELRLRSPGAAAALAVAVRAAVNETEIGYRGLGVPVAGRDGRACLLHVLPLAVGASPRALTAGALAAIFVAPATEPLASNVGRVACLFGLTATESAILETMIDKGGVADIAAAHGIGAATVKTHLQHIFDKTGVRRQAELVGLISSFALPLRP